MFRLFYRWLLRFHPACFRERFAEEMLSIFDHAETRTAAAELVADAFISLVRQWTMRSEYWEEKPTLSALAGAGGLPGFYTLESFKARKGALIGGAVLTWIACSVVFLVLSHSRVHYVYVPSVSFESIAGPDVELPTSIPNLAPTPVRVRPRTQSAIEPRTNLSEPARPSLGKPMPSEANSSAVVSNSQEQAGLDASGKLRRTITTPPLVQYLRRSPASPQSVRQDESKPAGGGWWVKRVSSTPEQALDSTLAALKERGSSQSHLSQGLAHVMMRFAEDGQRPPWPLVASFADKLARELIGRQLNSAQITALRQCIIEVMRRTGTSNLNLASRLQETLAGIGVDSSKTQLVVRDFILLREAVQGSDDSPLVP